jgi:hypothetical protein
MIVRIDKPGQYQPSGRIDDFVHDVGCKIGADGKYLVVFDQDIGDRGLMHITIVVVDLAASDQRSFPRHLSSILRSSAPGETKPNIRIPAHAESLIPMWLSGRAH